MTTTSGTSAKRGAPAPNTSKVIRDKPFADRLSTACDSHSLAPQMHYGRLTWLKAQLEQQFDEKVSTESVRKWFAGEARPRPAKMKLVAQLLGVDEAWLSLGVQPDLNPRERKLRNATVDGAVNVVAGLIQMAGGHPAFPEPDDKKSKGVDIYAIIKGAQYAIKVALAQRTNETEFRFVIPIEYAERTVLGLVQTGPMAFEVIEISSDAIDEHKVRKGGHYELNVEQKKAGYVVGTTVLKQITTFAERL